MLNIDRLNLKAFAFFFLLYAVGLDIYGIQCILPRSYVSQYSLILLPGVFCTFAAFMVLISRNTDYEPYFWYSIRVLLLSVIAINLYPYIYETFPMEQVEFIFVLMNLMFTGMTILLAFETRISTNFYASILYGNLIYSYEFYYAFFGRFSFYLVLSSIASAIAYLVLFRVFGWNEIDTKYDEHGDIENQCLLKSTMV